MSDDLILAAARRYDEQYLVSRDHSRSGGGIWRKVFLPESLIERLEKAADEYYAAQEELERHLDQPRIQDADSLDVEKLKADFLAWKDSVHA